MKKIPLTQGKFALVDDEDFEYLNQWKWHFSHGYAMKDFEDGRVYMHRLINNTPKGMLTDHINRNGLDNRKCNLRTADKKINSINRGLQANNTSGYRGVYWCNNFNKWVSQIKVDQRKIHLGYFIDKLDAINARKEGELKFFKQYL